MKKIIAAALAIASVFTLASCAQPEKVIDSIEISKAPDKTEYIHYYDNALDLSGGEVTVKYIDKNGIEEYEPETYPLSEEPHLKSDVDFSLTGKFKVYLDYEGVDSSYEVNVGNLGGSGVDEQEQKNLLAMCDSGTKDDRKSIKKTLKKYFEVWDKVTVADDSTAREAILPEFESLTDKNYGIYATLRSLLTLDDCSVENANIESEGITVHYIFINNDGTASVSICNDAVFSQGEIPEDTKDGEEVVLPKFTFTTEHQMSLVKQDDGSWLIAYDSLASNTTPDTPVYY